MTGCTTGLIPSVLMLFALLVGDELVTLVTLTVATGKVLGHAHTDMAGCTIGRTPTTAVLMLFALLVSDELVRLTVARGNSGTYRHDRYTPGRTPTTAVLMLFALW